MTTINPLASRIAQAIALAIPALCFATAAFAEAAKVGQPGQGNGIEVKAEAPRSAETTSA